MPYEVDDDGNLTEYDGPKLNPKDLIPYKQLAADNAHLMDQDFGHIADPRKRSFLWHFSWTCNVSDAARYAGVSPGTPRKWAKADSEFAAEYEATKELVADNLEAEAFRRATEGVEEPVFQGGKCVGYIRKRSDTLLIFMLKAYRPEKYREKWDVVSGSVVNIHMGVNELPFGV